MGDVSYTKSGHSNSDKKRWRIVLVVVLVLIVLLVGSYFLLKSGSLAKDVPSDEDSEGEGSQVAEINDSVPEVNDSPQKVLSLDELRAKYGVEVTP